MSAVRLFITVVPCALFCLSSFRFFLCFCLGHNFCESFLLFVKLVSCTIFSVTSVGLFVKSVSWTLFSVSSVRLSVTLVPCALFS